MATRTGNKFGVEGEEGDYSVPRIERFRGFLFCVVLGDDGEDDQSLLSRSSQHHHRHHHHPIVQRQLLGP